MTDGKHRAHAARPAGCRPGRRVTVLGKPARPYTSATASRAQRIRAAAFSGCSPNSCATRPAHPAAPNWRMAAATACRTCRAPGSCDGCSADTNKASDRTALMLQWFIAGSVPASPAS
jgi:hypothetical protein